MTKVQKLLAYGSALGAGVLGFASTAFMAADADVASTTATLATSMKDNIVGVLTANIGTLAIAGLVIVGVFVIWKVGRRFVGR